jgi:hypothetical protein
MPIVLKTWLTGREQAATGGLGNQSASRPGRLTLALHAGRYLHPQQFQDGGYHIDLFAQPFHALAGGDFAGHARDQFIVEVPSFVKQAMIAQHLAVARIDDDEGAARKVELVQVVQDFAVYFRSPRSCRSNSS